MDNSTVYTREKLALFDPPIELWGGPAVSGSASSDDERVRPRRSKSRGPYRKKKLPPTKRVVKLWSKGVGKHGMPLLPPNDPPHEQLVEWLGACFDWLYAEHKLSRRDRIQLIAGHVMRLVWSKSCIAPSFHCFLLTLHMPIDLHQGTASETIEGLDANDFIFSSNRFPWDTLQTKMARLGVVFRNVSWAFGGATEAWPSEVRATSTQLVHHSPEETSFMVKLYHHHYGVAYDNGDPVFRAFVLGKCWSTWAIMFAVGALLGGDLDDPASRITLEALSGMCFLKMMKVLDC